MRSSELTDVHIGILAELYWNGQQRSRTTPDLRADIICLIDAKLVKEFQRKSSWWGLEWFARISPRGVDVLDWDIDPLRVFNVLLTIVDSVPGASRWVMKFNRARLPIALAHPNEEIRDAAGARLMEIENNIELSDNQKQVMMVCYRSCLERPRDWIPSRAERRLTLLGFLKATPNGVGFALNLTDKGTRFLEDHYPIRLVEFLVNCMDGGPYMPTLLDSFHVGRLIRLLDSFPLERLAELLVSDNEYTRYQAMLRLERLSG